MTLQSKGDVDAAIKNAIKKIARWSLEPRGQLKFLQAFCLGPQPFSLSAGLCWDLGLAVASDTLESLRAEPRRKKNLWFLENPMIWAFVFALNKRIKIKSKMSQNFLRNSGFGNISPRQANHFLSVWIEIFDQGDFFLKSLAVKREHCSPGLSKIPLRAPVRTVNSRRALPLPAPCRKSPSPPCPLPNLPPALPHSHPPHP